MTARASRSPHGTIGTTMKSRAIALNSVALNEPVLCASSTRAVPLITSRTIASRYCARKSFVMRVDSMMCSDSAASARKV